MTHIWYYQKKKHSNEIIHMNIKANAILHGNNEAEISVCVS